MLGRESERKKQRSDRFRFWCQERSRYALASVLLGMLSLPDVAIVIPGIAAVVTGALGLRELKQKPGVKGKNLCLAGIVLGSISLLVAIVIYSSRFWYHAET